MMMDTAIGLKRKRSSTSMSASYMDTGSEVETGAISQAEVEAELFAEEEVFYH